jgi:23S rRNA (pseudouridine1915-N3)-methyltransferase
MKIVVLVIGKTNEKYLETGIEIFLKRLKHYISFDIQEIADVKGIQDSRILMEKEAEQFLKFIKDEDFLVLCDERGRLLTSVEMAEMISKKMTDSTKRMIFLVGGAFGVSDAIRKRSNFILSLSKMTFSHQMIRLFLTEQVYRAYTIIKNEKYHNI